MSLMMRRRMMIGQKNNLTNDNLIIISECTDGISMPNGLYVTPGVLLATPFKEIFTGKTYYSNLTRHLPDGSTIWNQGLFLYDCDKTYIGFFQFSKNYDYGLMHAEYSADNEQVKYVRIVFQASNENPYFGESGVL